MSENKLDLVSPIGRLVGGSLHKKYDKDHQGNPKKNPNYFFAVAFDKNDPVFGQIIQQMYQVATTAYAQNQNVLHNIQTSYQTGFGAGFAWKLDDGDNPKFNGRSSYAGHWVLGFSTTLDFQVVNSEFGLMDPQMVKLGYYVQVAFNVAANGNTDHTAGLYVNPQCVQFKAYGEEITTGPTPQQLMQNAPQSQLPPGASATPIGGTPAPALPGAVSGAGGGNAPGMQQPAQGVGQQPAPALPGQQTGIVTEHPPIVDNAVGQQQPAPALPGQQTAPGMGNAQPGAPVAGSTGQVGYPAQTPTQQQQATVSPGNMQQQGQPAPALPQGVQPNHQFAQGQPPMPGQGIKDGDVLF